MPRSYRVWRMLPVVRIVLALLVIQVQLLVKAAEDYLDNTLPKTIDMPPFTGERYEVEIPNTLDLAERAAIAINCLTEDGHLGPGWFYSKSPMMSHLDCAPKYLESLPLMRIMSGSMQNIEQDKKVL